MPPDWDAFKVALFWDYPNVKEPSTSSAILDIFINEKSCQAIRSPAEFTMFNQEFQRITARLVMEGQTSPQVLRSSKRLTRKALLIILTCARRSSYT